MTRKLSKDAWLLHGFDVLKAQGHEGLKADPMARALGVSRGSFYWHFASLSEFHAALLQAWRARITETVISDLEQITAPNDRLSTLIRRTLETPQDVERAMRRWGGQNPAVLAVLEDTDQRRISYLTTLLGHCGIAESEAKARATMLSWAFIGRAFAPGFVEGLTPHAPVDLAEMVLSAPERSN